MNFLQLDNISTYLPMLGWEAGLVVLILALLGLILIFTGFSRLVSKKLIRASLYGCSGLLLLTAGLLVLLIAVNIHTYHRLTYEQEIAIISFRQQTPQQYRTKIRYLETGITDEYLLKGDEWQIDARILRWQPIGQLLGLNALYRLERISGRYQDLALEQKAPRTVYALSESPGLDIWSIIRAYHDRLHWVDAYYGNATYLPMSDKVTYILSITQYGLIARPLNESTQTQLRKW